MTVEFLRWTFRRLDPAEIDPLGRHRGRAMAITVLAGSNLIAAAPRARLLTELTPFLTGVVILARATATFWFRC